MTKKNLKELVKSIERFAQAPPPPPAGAFLDPNAPGPFGGGTTRGHGSTGDHGEGGGGGNTAVMTMQHALQDLAQTVSAQINLQDVSSGDPRKEQEAKARDAFGVFLTKNYMRNTKVTGVEYDPDPKATDMSKKRPDDPTRMSVVMDTMNRIGTPKHRGEQFVDGNWGPRTNAAVRDSYAFASGLFSFVDDVNRFATNKMQIQSYSKDSLKNLEGMATVDNSLTPSQKSEAAPLVTQHVKAIKNMYEEVKNKVLEHAAYRQFIEQDVPFKTYKGRGVTPEQLAAIKKAFPQGFQLQFPEKHSGAAFYVEDFLSMDALKKALQRQGGAVSPEEAIAAFAKLVQKTAEQPPAPLQPQTGMV